MINTQKLSYKINLTEIPISKNLKKIINLKNLIKSILYLKEMIIRFYLQPLRIKEESLKN